LNPFTSGRERPSFDSTMRLRMAGIPELLASLDLANSRNQIGHAEVWLGQ
jgi:hypothetical protein